MTISMETLALQALATGLAPVALYGVSIDGSTCHCPKGVNCPSKGKHPIWAKWASEPFPTPEEVSATFRRHPTAQAGIRTGSVSNNLVVVDFDQGGREAFAPLVRQNGGMPETLVVQTGGGGQHFYYQAPPGVIVPNSQSKLAPGVDIRGEGGQAVGPGARTDKGEYSVLHSAPIAPIPPWLLELALATRGGEIPMVAPAPKRPQSDAEAMEEARRVGNQLSILSELKAKPWEPGDAWDSKCFEAACHLIELANSEWTRITHEEAHQAFMDHAPYDGKWDERAKCWRSAVRQAGGKAKEVPVDIVTLASAAQPPAGPSQAAPATPEPEAAADPRSDSDATMVEEFAQAVLTGQALYVREQKEWRLYDEGVWREGSIPEVREMFRGYVLQQMAIAGRRGDSDRLKHLAQYAAAAGKIKSIEELSRGRMLVGLNVFDQYPDLLTVGNGTVNLMTSELGPHVPGHMFTRKTGTHYRPGARHPDWDAALQALPEGTADWMQIRIGQAITGHPTWDDVLPILQGTGSNGKSSIIAGLQKALGGHVGMVSERVLLANASDHPTEMVDLRGMRMAIIEELPQDGALNIKRLKDLLGTSSIRARRIRENTVEWTPTHSLFLTTNYIPRVNETDDGTWRRLALVQFPWHYIKAHEQPMSKADRRGDAGLRGRLEAGQDGQHEAILAWCIEGARRWYGLHRGELAVPAVVEKATGTWRTEADKIWGFLSERIEFDTASKVLSADLFHEFTNYLGSIGAAKWADNTFAIRLREHHLAREHGITKVRVRNMDGLSRPGQVFQTFAPGQAAMVWTGMRFKDKPEPRTGTVSLLDNYR